MCGETFLWKRKLDLGWFGAGLGLVGNTEKKVGGQLSSLFGDVLFMFSLTKEKFNYSLKIP